MCRMALSTTVDGGRVGKQAKHAGPGRGHKTGNNITRFRRGTDPTYIRARLERDGRKAFRATMPAIASRKPATQSAGRRARIRLLRRFTQPDDEIWEHANFGKRCSA
jgi:hypothetical protein